MTGISGRCSVLLLIALFTMNAQSATRHGWVLKTGEVLTSSGGPSPNMAGFSCADEQAAFSFSESVEPEQLELARRDLGSGSVLVSLSINEVCASGQATFEYAHVAEQGQIGEDIGISPVQTTITASLVVQNLDARTFEYQVLDVDTPGEIDKVFRLEAGGITFIADGSFGQAARSETLATITIVEGPPLDTENPALREDQRTLDAAEAFNNACEDVGAETDLARLCDAAADTDSEGAIQIAEAFDPHELSAAPGAVVEGGRIQAANIGGRLAALRGGATGISLNGIALAYNGNILDSSWLPADAIDEAGSEAGGGSSLLSERLGFFVNGEISLGDRDRRGKEFGFDFNSWGLTSGIDYRFRSGLVGGISLGYSRYDADLDDDGGSLESDTVTLQGYGTYSFTEDLYLDATLGYSNSNLDQDRVIDLTGIGSFGRSVARGSTDARQYSTSLALNYRLPLDTSWSLTSYGQLFYAINQIDGFEERGSVLALRFPDQEFFTRSFSAGLRASKAITFATGVLSPFVDAGYSHESGNDGYALQPTIVETGGLGPVVEISSPDRNFGRVDAGASWVFLSGQQVFFSYSALVGESDTARHAFYFGARFEF